MKIVSTISRYLLGLLFSVFGLNGFLDFIHQPRPIIPLALRFTEHLTIPHARLEVRMQSMDPFL